MSALEGEEAIDFELEEPEKGKQDQTEICKDNKSQSGKQEKDGKLGLEGVKKMHPVGGR